MSNNPHVKSLKLFNPKKNLIVNEKFKVAGHSAMGDALSDLEFGDDSSGEGAGSEVYSMKTGGSIKSGIKAIKSGSGLTLLLVTNKNGEIQIITPESNSFKILMKIRIQGSIIRTPVIEDGILYCTTREGMIYAINLGLRNDGKLNKPSVVWKQRTKKGILTEPIATGKLLIVATLGGLYGFEAYFENKENKSIGRFLWEQRLNGVVSSPRIYSGHIYVGSEDKNLYAFEYGGTKVTKAWSYKASGAIRVKPAISKQKNQILFTTIDGFLYCLDLFTGKYKWNYVIKNSGYSTIVSEIIDNEELFFVGCDSGVMYCINSFGKKVWHFKTNGKIRTEPLIHGSKLFFGSEDNNLYSLDLKTGKKLFQFSTDGNINSSPVVVDDIVYFGSTDSFIHGVRI